MAVTYSASLANAVSSTNTFQLVLNIVADASVISGQTLTFNSPFTTTGATGATWVSSVQAGSIFVNTINAVNIPAFGSLQITINCKGIQNIPATFLLNGVPMTIVAFQNGYLPFDPFLSVVSNLIGRFGGTAQLIHRPANNVYDPTSGKVTAIPISYNVRIVAFDFLQKRDGDSTMTNTLVKAGDKQIYMQFDSTVPTPIAHVDELVYAGNTFQIITVKQLNSSGSNVVYTEMFIRGG